MTVADTRRDLLRRQLDIMWAFAEELVIDKIDRAAVRWEPSDNVCTVRAGTDGWVADWPDEANPPLPDVTIAWVLWHIEWWWTDTIGRVRGDTGLPPDAYVWSGGTTHIVRLKSQWDEVLAEADLDGMILWLLPEPQPLWFIASWVNVELTKNLAEINQIRVRYENSVAGR